MKLGSQLWDLVCFIWNAGQVDIAGEKSSLSCPSLVPMGAAEKADLGFVRPGFQFQSRYHPAGGPQANAFTPWAIFSPSMKQTCLHPEAATSI